LNLTRAAHFDFKLLEGVSPKLKELIVRCLDHEPTKRFTDAKSMQQAMQAILREM
jgi:serine/threonine protein kinase